MKNWFCCCLLIVSCVFRAALFAADSSQQAGAALPAGAPAAGHGGVPSRHQALLQPPSTGGRGKQAFREREASSLPDFFSLFLKLRKDADSLISIRVSVAEPEPFLARVGD